MSHSAAQSTRGQLRCGNGGETESRGLSRGQGEAWTNAVDWDACQAEEVTWTPTTSTDSWKDCEDWAGEWANLLAPVEEAAWIQRDEARH